jgi:dTDP-4-dehydrorhamnose reductase
MIGSGSQRLASSFSDRRTSETELAIMRIVVTGASGQLGSYLLDDLKGSVHEIVGWSGRTADSRGRVGILPVELTDHAAVARALEDANPDLVIHSAAVSSAEVARRDPRRSEAVNVGATRFLSEWAAHHDRRLIYTSTDLVFDGSRSWYCEDDPAHPIGVYGQTKHAAEHFVLDVPRGLVVRLSLLYGPSRSGRDGYFDRTTAALKTGTPQAFFSDEHRTPLDYRAAARVLVRLAESDALGVVHVGGPERLSRFDLMRRAAPALGIDPLLIKPNRRADVSLPEPRPADLSLDCTRLRSLFPDLVLPPIEDALAPASGHSTEIENATYFRQHN